MDPHLEQGTGLAVFPRLYGYLLHIDSRDESLILDHAAQVEQPEPSIYVITLRPEIRFHDVAPAGGRTVTAADVVASVQRYRGNAALPDRLWHTTVLDRIEATDERTVRVITKFPYAYSLSAMCGINAGAILPKEIIEQRVDLYKKACGSGPFRLEQEQTDTFARIVRNDAYYDQSLPYLDAMEWTILEGDDVRVAAYQSRQADVTPNRDRAEAEALAADFPDNVTVTAPSLAYLSLGMRVDRPPFSDERVRGAFELALDRDALIRELTGGAGDVCGPINPHLAYGFWSLPDDEIRAFQVGGLTLADRITSGRAYIEAAGLSGTAVRLQIPAIPSLIDAATIIRQQLQALGIQIVLDELDQLTWFSNVRRGEFEATLLSHAPYEAPDQATRFYHTGGPYGTGTNPFRFSNAEIDRLIERSWGESNREERRETLLTAQRLMLSARPMLPLFSGIGYTSHWDYVQELGAELPGSLPQFQYGQWLEPGHLDSSPTSELE
jgi:peptide/nickel transport system substrate-binding protein